MNLKLSFFSVIIAIITLSANAQNVNFEWAKSIGGMADDLSRSIVIDSYGNLYITGSFSGTVDFDPGPATFNLTSNGSDDIFITKMDALGNFLWAKNIGGSLSDFSTSVITDPLNNVYLTGGFQDIVDFNPGLNLLNLNSNGDYDIFILKLDSAGNFIWAKSMGGTWFDFSSSIKVDAGGNIYTTGSFTSTADFDPNNSTFFLSPPPGGSNEIFISKLDSAGNFIWAKSMGGTSIDISYSLAIDEVCNVYTTGTFRGTSDFDPSSSDYSLGSAGGSDDCFISKLDSSGNFIWANCFGAMGYDWGGNITVDKDGNVYTTGSFIGTIDFDPGLTNNYLTSTGDGDIFILKLNNAGTLVWAKRMGGLGYDYGLVNTVDSVGNVYITGGFQDTVDFDPGPAFYNLNSLGGNNIFILKLNPLGSFEWAKSIGGQSSYNGNSIAIDKLGNVYTTGDFQGAVDFDPGMNIYNLNSTGGADVFIQKLSQISTGLSEEQVSRFRIFPNPTNDELNIQVEASVIGSTYQLSDITGRPITTGIITEKESRISLQGLSSGTYLLSIGDQIRKTLKVVKE
jgi:hypothetical protein